MEIVVKQSQLNFCLLTLSVSSQNFAILMKAIVDGVIRVNRSNTK